jgi:hypothetical protein
MTVLGPDQTFVVRAASCPIHPLSMMLNLVPVSAHGVHVVDFASNGFELRRARGDDFQFCWSLYEELMKSLTVGILGRWNESGQKQVIEWALTQRGTSVIVKDELDVGWMQVIE